MRLSCIKFCVLNFKLVKYNQLTIYLKLTIQHLKQHNETFFNLKFKIHNLK